MAEKTDVPAEQKTALPQVEKAGKLIQAAPQTFEELWGFCNKIAQTELVPDADRGKPGQVLAKIQYGSEVGLPPMQALRFIAVVNGHPTIYGAGAKMLVMSHPLCELLQESDPLAVQQENVATCIIKRRGYAQPISRSYTKQMAEQAGLWGGKGKTVEGRAESAWAKYPWRMLMWRAFHLAAVDAIPEALGGLLPTEIAKDIDIVVESAPVKEPIQAPKALEESPDEVQQASAETISPDGRDTSSKSATDGDQEKDKKPNPSTGRLPTLEEALAWIKKATLEELAPVDNYAFTGLKRRPQAEQVSICRAMTDRKAMLSKEEKK